MEHIEVLQRQISLLQSQLAPPSGSHGPSAASLGETRPGRDMAALHDVLLELPFLRQRVEQLSVENRQLRRQCAQMKLAAASSLMTASASASAAQAGQGGPVKEVTETHVDAIASTSGSGQSGTQGQLLLPRFEDPHTSQARATTAQPPPPPPPTREEEALRRDLSEATSELLRLRAENQRLMEMSSALRAERDRLKAAGGGGGWTMAAAVTGGPSTSSWQQPASTPAAAVVVPSPPPPGSNIAPNPSPTTSPAHTPYLVYTTAASQSIPPGSFTVLSSQETRHQGGPRHPDTLTASTTTGRLPSSAIPSSVIFVQEDVEVERMAAGSGLRQDGGGGSHPVAMGGGGGRRGQAGGIFKQLNTVGSGYFIDSSLRRTSAMTSGDPGHVEDPHGGVDSRGEASGLAAAEAEVAIARAMRHHRSQSPSAIRSAGRSASFPSASTGHHRSVVVAGEVGGMSPPHDPTFAPLVASQLSPGSRPPSAVPGSASSRETASQRTRLQALQRRGEEEASRPRVRNYNMRD